ncbi:hypothetical protein [Halohasta litorea]|uniref:Small CPxCG-related zinc finger protein n=1 Tax=Halohasta litorea TaxID=869891 RepID=A0ABD6DAB5_9EURY|nr:hypothetical protein [Halohasta litorea]MEA1931773.1 hypothetical protein [Euryarchaeota archaeon]
MGFNWLSANACPSCTVIPSAADYDDFGYPVCPSCGTIIRSEGGDEQIAAAHSD